MASNPIKIGFIEDNELLLENYKEYFDSSDEFTCTFAFGTIPDLFTYMKSNYLAIPDIVLVDIQLPEINGIEGIPLLQERLAGTRIVMMTAFDDKESVMSAFSNGAAGFLTKNMSLNAVSESLLSLVNHGAALSPSAARILIASVGQKMQKINSIINRLTPREREIARFIKSGLSYQQIADQLFISARTVNQHLKHIYQKVGVNSRSQLAAKMEE
ncbi:MAG: response regulator transcription factor [Sphingobacteriaceae bacterium]|nr:response regulator transcription factor [Sphingobacteriaceae bacterium]